MVRRWLSSTVRKGHSTWFTGILGWPSANGTGRCCHLMEHHLFRQSAHLPTLVVGDFNDWRNTLARALCNPRLSPVDRAAIALSIVPGLLARDLTGQGVCPRRPGHPPDPDRPLPPGPRRLRPPAAGHRLSSRTPRHSGSHDGQHRGRTLLHRSPPGSMRSFNDAWRLGLSRLLLLAR